MRLFADDTSAYISIKSTNDHQYLQQDLNNLQYWKENGKIAFHPQTNVASCLLLEIKKSYQSYLHHTLSSTGVITKKIDKI